MLQRLSARMLLKALITGRPSCCETHVAKIFGPLLDLDRIDIHLTSSPPYRKGIPTRAVVRPFSVGSCC